MSNPDWYLDPPEDTTPPCVCGGTYDDHCNYHDHTQAEKLELCETSLDEIDHILEDQSLTTSEALELIHRAAEKRHRACAHCDECLEYEEQFFYDEETE